MFRYSIVFLCAVLVLSNVEFIQAGKWGGGGGGRSGGYSGGRHGYPSSSGGLSGSGGGNRHGYPSSSGGLSGNSHGSGYPAGGGSHGYPSGGGGYSGGSHTHPNSGGNKYPPSTGNSGSHGYPNSGSGLSGSNNQGYPNRGGSSGGTTNIHHHYHYNPPQQIHYASPHGGPAMNYPVYRGNPPTYVYAVKDSGSKYSSLLTGLALFNLGALAGGAVGYGIGHHSSSNNNNNYQNYRAQPGEVCLFGIKKDNGDFEETRIECQLISSFIYADEQAKLKQQNAQNQTTVTTTVTNTTVVNTSNAQDTPAYVLSPNGTLVTPGAAPDGANVTNEAPAGGTVTSSVITTTTNTTVVNAVDVKGSPIQVTPGMQCYVIRKTNSSRMKHEVPCGLLQTYADKSIKPNSAARNVPAFTILAVICAVFVVY